MTIQTISNTQLKPVDNVSVYIKYRFISTVNKLVHCLYAPKTWKTTVKLSSFYSAQQSVRVINLRTKVSTHPTTRHLYLQPLFNMGSGKISLKTLFAKQSRSRCKYYVIRSVRVQRVTKVRNCTRVISSSPVPSFISKTIDCCVQPSLLSVRHGSLVLLDFNGGSAAGFIPDGSRPRGLFL